MATLGIDFGTSYTFIVKYDGKEFNRMGAREFYSRPADDTTNIMKAKGIRTAIGLANDGHWVVGSYNLNQAIANGELDRKNICWDIKSKLRGLDLLMVDENDAINMGLESIYQPGMDVSDLRERESYGKIFIKPNGEERYVDALEMAHEFFKCILTTKTDNPSDIDFSDIECIACGMPADELDSTCPDRIDYEEKLRSAILGYINKDILKLNLDKSRLLLREEPILAGISYFKNYPGTLRSEDVILVIDIGGGTSDFALFTVDEANIPDGKINVTLRASKGGTSPAGDVFNRRLVGCIQRKFPNAYREEDVETESVSNAKESLFLSKFSSRIGYFRKVYSEKYTLDDMPLDEPLDEQSKYTESQILEIFNRRGRRTKIKNESDSNTPYKIVYSREHCAGLKEDGFGEPWNPSEVIEIGSQFEEVYRKVANRVMEFLKGDVASKYKDKINKVLFIGGSCRMPELRNKICTLGIGLETSDGRSYRYRNGEKPVQIYFLETESESKNLSCSNAIALGAAYEAYDWVYRHEIAQSGPNIHIHNTLVVPELWIKFKKDPDQEEICLLSQAYKNEGAENAGLKYFPFRARNLGANDLDNGNSLHFQIGRTVAGKKIFYPRPYMRKKKDGTTVPIQRTFSYRLKFPEEHEELCFFADIINSGEVAVFVCPKCAESDVAQGIYEYKYVFLNNERSDIKRPQYQIIPGIQIPKSKTARKADVRCKKYTLIEKFDGEGKSHEDESKDEIKGEKFNVRTYLQHKASGHDNQWFGWFLIDNIR